MDTGCQTTLKRPQAPTHTPKTSPVAPNPQKEWQEGAARRRWYVEDLESPLSPSQSPGRRRACGFAGVADTETSRLTATNMSPVPRPLTEWWLFFLGAGDSFAREEFDHKWKQLCFLRCLCSLSWIEGEGRGGVRGMEERERGRDEGGGGQENREGVNHCV